MAGTDAQVLLRKPSSSPYFASSEGYYTYLDGSCVLAKKTSTLHRWMAWIQFFNVYLMTQIAGVSGWWTVAFFMVFIPLIGSLVVLVVSVYLWWKIAERVGRPGWWAILMMVPVVNFIVMGMLAWGKSAAPIMKSQMKRAKVISKKKK